MRRLRALRIGHRLVSLLRRRPAGYHRLHHQNRRRPIACKLLRWCRRLWSPLAGAPSRAPKGHLAVYVGKEEEDVDGRRPIRLVVPVVYLNHPLFADLLRQSERVYGFDQQGGIKLPCHVSEFESVRTRVEAAGGRRCASGKRRNWL